jgi:hypothetical protein
MLTACATLRTGKTPLDKPFACLSHWYKTVVMVIRIRQAIHCAQQLRKTTTQEKYR